MGWTGASRWSRRSVLAGATAAAGLGPVVAAAVAAAPVRAAAAPILLTARPWYPGSYTPTLGQLMNNALDPFRAAHPGVDVQLNFELGTQGPTIAAMLAGQGVDVVWDWVVPPYLQNGLLMDLEPYVRRDNLSLDVFPSGEMSFFESAAIYSPSGRGLYAVPAYLHTSLQVVNLGVLDDLGLTYPEDGWTWQDWTKMWTAVAKRSGSSSQRRVGGQLDWTGYDYNYDNPSPYIYHGFGGEFVDAADPTRCVLDAAGSVACGEWAYGLQREGIVGNGNIGTGQLVSEIICTCGGLPTAATQLRGVKWDIFPMPVWPKGRFNFAASDFNAIWSGTKHPDLAWELLKFLSFEPYWQRLVMVRLGWSGPSLKSVWGDWVQLIQQAAPVMRSKNLKSVQDSVLNNEPYFGYLFRYEDSQSAAVIHQLTAKAQAQQLSVSAAYQQATRQVDAIQALGPQLSAQGAAQAAAFAKYTHQAAASATAILYPAPPLKGSGQAPTAAPKLAVADAATGGYTITGAGSGDNSYNDGGTFAGQAYRSSRGTFTARLTSIAAVKDGSISDGAKIGLSIRADLSSASARIDLHVAMGRGVHWSARLPEGNNSGDAARPTSPSAASGLFGVNAILRPDGAPAANYLLRPVWLRLVLDIDRITPYTSLDGAHWTQAAEPLGTDFVGAWVGFFVTSHNPGHYIAAKFDHVSGFVVNTVEQVGSA